MLVIITLLLLGLIFGSFAGAQVWRLRARQLMSDKKDGEKYDKNEYKRLKPLMGPSLKDDHSRCLMCGHRLGMRDLLPLVSWLSTGGKCRYCHQPIGWLEPLMEGGMALAFVVSYVFWPLGLTTLTGQILFVIWLVALVVLAILFVYDLKWYLLPNKLNFALIGLGMLASLITIVAATDTMAAIISVIISVAVLSGIYAVLWLISKGAWIGFGDVKLGLGLALLLADWRSALIALFMANLIGCIAVIPGLVTKKISRSSHVPFGPLLIAGTFIAMLWGVAIAEWYSHFLI